MGNIVFFRWVFKFNGCGMIETNSFIFLHIFYTIKSYFFGIFTNKLARTRPQCNVTIAQCRPSRRIFSLQGVCCTWNRIFLRFRIRRSSHVQLNAKNIRIDTRLNQVKFRGELPTCRHCWCCPSSSLPWLFAHYQSGSGTLGTLVDKLVAKKCGNQSESCS